MDHWTLSVSYRISYHVPGAVAGVINKWDDAGAHRAFTPPLPQGDPPMAIGPPIPPLQYRVSQRDLYPLVYLDLPLSALRAPVSQPLYRYNSLADIVTSR